MKCMRQDRKSCTDFRRLGCLHRPTEIQDGERLLYHLQFLLNDCSNEL